MLDTPLAKGFDILSGRQQVTLPADVAPGDDYSVVRELLFRCVHVTSLLTSLSYSIRRLW